MKNTITKTIIVETLTPTYDKLEDRIRLSINYQNINNRIDLMITRNFILQVLPTIEEYIYKFYPDTNLENMVHIQIDELEYKEDIDNRNKQENEQLLQTNMEDLQLLKSLEDLMFTLNLKYDQNTKLTIIEFISKSKHKALFTCDVDTLKNVLRSLKTAIPSMNWGISGLI